MRNGISCLRALAVALLALAFVPLDDDPDCVNSTCKTKSVTATPATGGGFTYEYECEGDCANCGSDSCEEKTIGRLTSCFCGGTTRTAGNPGPCRVTVHSTATGSSVQCDNPCANGCSLLETPVPGTNKVKVTCDCSP